MSNIERTIREELETTESNPDAPNTPEVDLSRPNRVRIGIPDIDLRKIREYAEQVVPQDIQDQIRMEVDVRGNTVAIIECRPPWTEDSEAEWTRQGVAKMKFAPDNGKWSLYWSDSNSR